MRDFADNRMVQGEQRLDGGVRGGEYRSYYEKYYENRDSSLHAIAQSGPKVFPLTLRRCHVAVQAAARLNPRI